ncbi:MAG: hypothetical protein GWP14_05585 [Actinobacteria bacterium]|nr:hypothetical protein [Actinomycetota bacterium]
MGRTPQKGMVYFDILEALRKSKVCILCDLEFSNIRRYLDNLLYEKVNDVGVRRDLSRSRGYCRRHAHMLLEFADGLGSAILYRDQVQLFLDFLKGLDSLPGKLRSHNLPESWNHEALCPACVTQARCRKRYVECLLEWLGEPHLRKAFDDSPGLCVPHLLLVLGQIRDAASRTYLIGVQVSKFSALVEDLAEFIRKQDYRFCGQSPGREKGSWQRAVSMMVGVKDVF